MTRSNAPGFHGHTQDLKTGKGYAAGLGGITLVSADQDLNTAASAEGLMVEAPNAHP